MTTSSPSALNTPHGLPPVLRKIFERVEKQPPALSNLPELHSLWGAYIDQARQAVPGLQVEGEGELVVLGELSPGCRACKDGTWDCVFVTARCNLSCPFCYSPHAIPPDYTGSVFGSKPEQILANQRQTTITGISFSGGEPFSQPERLLEWLTVFIEHRPEAYYWVYTNGLRAEPALLRQLAALGLDEIRFNAAATGYAHLVVLRHMAEAAQYIPHVTVEVPAIPEQADRLLEALPAWSSRGVRYLNLHELMFEPGTNAAALPGPRQTVITPDGHRTAVHSESRRLTLAVMRRVQELGLPLSVNDCSLQSKLRQLRGRRASLLPLTRSSDEKFVEGELLESACVVHSEKNFHFFHPDLLESTRMRFPAARFFRLVRRAPLDPKDNGRWVAFEELR